MQRWCYPNCYNADCEYIHPTRDQIAFTKYPVISEGHTGPLASKLSIGISIRTGTVVCIICQYELFGIGRFATDLSHKGSFASFVRLCY